MTTMPPSGVSTLGNRSMHKPFSWVHDNDRANPSAIRNAEAMDAFRGIATCLELIEMSNLDREMADPDDPTYVVPMLSVQDTSRLMRLAILVANEWGAKADIAMIQMKIEGGKS